MIGFEDLGGVVTDDDQAHLTVTYFHADGDAEQFVTLTIDCGNDADFAAVRLTAHEIRLLRNLLHKAERRLR